MAITIADNGEYIDVTESGVTRSYKKKYITMIVDEPYLYIKAHEKELRKQNYNRKIDFNDVTVPVVASATALQSIIQGWIDENSNDISIQVGTSVASSGTVVFSNANSVSFGMAGNAITASFNALGGANPVFSAGLSSASLGSVVFSDSNGISFGLNGSTITASHNGITSQSVQTQNSVQIQGSTGNISFANSNGITFGGNASTITASYTVPTVTNSSWTASAGTQSATVSQLVFSNSNGVSFGLNNGTVTASHNGVTSQSSQPINISITGVGTFSGTSGSGYNFSLSFDNLSAGISGNTIRVSHQRDTHTITAANGSATYGNQFGMFNLNGVSFSTTDSGGIRGFVASHNGITSQSVQPVAVSGSNGSFNFSTVTFGNLNGASFYSSNGSMVLSYTVPAAGGALSFSAGTSSGTFNSLVFSNANSVSFGLNGSTVTASFNAAAGADITLSMWPDRVPALNFVGTTNSGTTGNTGGSTQITASYHIASVQVPHPVVFDNLYGFNINSVTSAGTGSATVGHGLGLYSLDANTVMNLISSWQWQMYVSQNSVTARSHHWFWGSQSSANSSAANGNISASFTNPSGAGRKILLSNGVNTIPAGNYYLVSVYTCRSNGLNAYNNGSQAIMDGVNIFSAHTMMGEANITRAVGFNGVFSSTTNISTVAQPIMPSTINTNAITISGTNQSGTHRVPLIIFERSKS